MIKVLLFVILSAGELFNVPCIPDISIHVIGMSGHGKSRFVFNLTEDARALSGSSETTKEVTKFLFMNAIVNDYPGFGTPQFPIKHWIETYQTFYNKNSSFVILVVGARIYEQHVSFLESLTKFKRFLVLRSQTDIFPITQNEFNDYWNKQKMQREPDQICVDKRDVITEIVDNLRYLGIGDVCYYYKK
jgi:GTP-binding protein EngB required for normal cell division